MRPRDMTMTGVVLGTPGYLAPERRAGHAATVQSDLYSVGAVMVEALSGRRPVPGENLDRELPPDLRPIATKALATDPQQRFSSAEEMLHALRHARGGPRRRALQPVAATEPVEGATAVLPTPPRTSLLTSPPAPSPRARPHRWRRYLLPGAAALIVLVLLLLFLLTPGQSAPTARRAASRNDRGPSPRQGGARPGSHSHPSAGHVARRAAGCRATRHWPPRSTPPPPPRPAPHARRPRGDADLGRSVVRGRRHQRDPVPGRRERAPVRPGPPSRRPPCRRPSPRRQVPAARTTVMVATEPGLGGNSGSSGDS